MLTKLKSKKISPRTQRYQPTTVRTKKVRHSLTMKQKVAVGSVALLGYNLFLLIAFVTGAGGIIGSFITIETLRFVGAGGAAAWIAFTSAAATLYLLPPGSLWRFYYATRRRITYRPPIERFPVSRPRQLAPITIVAPPPAPIPTAPVVLTVVQPNKVIEEVRGALLGCGYTKGQIAPLIDQMNPNDGQEALLRAAITELSKVAVARCKTR